MKKFSEERLEKMKEKLFYEIGNVIGKSSVYDNLEILEEEGDDIENLIYHILIITKLNTEIVIQFNCKYDTEIIDVIVKEVESLDSSISNDDLLSEYDTFLKDLDNERFNSLKTIDWKI